MGIYSISYEITHYVDFKVDAEQIKSILPEFRKYIIDGADEEDLIKYIIDSYVDGERFVEGVGSLEDLNFIIKHSRDTDSGELFHTHYKWNETIGKDIERFKKNGWKTK